MSEPIEIKLNERTKKLLENPQYNSLQPEQITYLMKGSWSAFFGYPVFAIANRLYLWGVIFISSLLLSYLNLFLSSKILSIVSITLGILSFILVIILAIKGRRLAWEKSKWSSFEIFKKRQRLINWLTVAFLIINFIIVTFGLATTLYKAFENEAINTQTKINTFRSQAPNQETAIKTCDKNTRDDKYLCLLDVARRFSDIKVCEMLPVESGVYKYLRNSCIEARLLDSPNTKENDCNSYFPSGSNYCFSYTALLNNDENICSKISTKERKSWCYTNIAILNSDLNICDKVDDINAKNNCEAIINNDTLLCKKIDLDWRKGFCIYTIAVKNNDLSMCEQIKDYDLSYSYQCRAVLTKKIEECNNISTDYGKGYCKMVTASAFGDENLCQNIEEGLYKNSCLAFVKNDINLCTNDTANYALWEDCRTDFNLISKNKIRWTRAFNGLADFTNFYYKKQ